MSLLPIHSHHRAPLVHFLSAGLTSTQAAAILHTSASYVRQCKRKDYSECDLLQDRYARDVKRQKTDPSVLTELCDFLATSCPTKSGDRCVTYHQYVSDDTLYEQYMTTVMAPVSFHTFYNIKQWMRVRHAGKYLGQFDCAKCCRFRQLQNIIPTASPADVPSLREEEQKCHQHQQLVFRSAISTSSNGLSSDRTTSLS